MVTNQPIYKFLLYNNTTLKQLYTKLTITVILGVLGY